MNAKLIKIFAPVFALCLSFSFSMAQQPTAAVANYAEGEFTPKGKAKVNTLRDMGGREKGYVATQTVRKYDNGVEYTRLEGAHDLNESLLLSNTTLAEALQIAKTIDPNYSIVSQDAELGQKDNYRYAVIPDPARNGLQVMMAFLENSSGQVSRIVSSYSLNGVSNSLEIEERGNGTVEIRFTRFF